MKKSFLGICLAFVLLLNMITPAFAQSNPEDGYMGNNEKTDVYQPINENRRAMITGGWYYEDGLKCFKDNNGNVVGKNAKKIIDVSQYNGNINWDKVSQTDVDGAILRIVSHSGGYYHIDSQFENNLNGCRKYNIPFGIYIYDYSNSVADAISEADMIINFLKQYKISPDELSYPVYLDMERDQISKTLNEQIVDAFVNKVTNAGYNTKVYSYRSMLQDQLNSPIIYQHVDWVAAYTSTLGFSNTWYSGPKGWQYSNGAIVDGIDGYVDMNVWYDQDQTVSKYEGWKKYYNQWYYGNKNGILQIGWEYVDDQWYYMNTSGVMQTGWLYDNAWYYLKSSGEMVTGLETIGSNLCYFNSNGAMQTGWQFIDSEWYYFDTSGYAKKGWYKEGNTWYYLKSDYKMARGLQTIGSNLCYFNSSGAMQTGWQKVDGKWYYFNASGYGVKGWIKLGNIWYYLDQNYQMLTGLQTIGSNLCYFSNSGAMQTGWQYVEEKWYYFNASGYAVKGWYKEGNVWYYLDNTGKMMTGWIEVSGKTYYLQANGKMVTGQVEIDGQQYLFSADGHLVK